MEVALVVDSTQSMLKPAMNWQNTKQWLKDLVDAFQIDGVHRRVGFIRWSNKIHHESTVLFSQHVTGKSIQRGWGTDRVFFFFWSELHVTPNTQ